MLVFHKKKWWLTGRVADRNDINAIHSYMKFSKNKKNIKTGKIKCKVVDWTWSQKKMRDL